MTGEIEAALTAANDAGVREHCRRLADLKWIDTGSCGYSTIAFQARSPMAKAALALGLADEAGKLVFFRLKLPPGVRQVQSSLVNHPAGDAVAAALTAAGLTDFAKRNWID